MKLSLTCFLAIVTSASVTAVASSESSSSSPVRRFRGGHYQPGNVQEEERAGKKVRRHLLEDNKECLLFKREIEWEDHHEDEGCWTCLFDYTEGEFNGKGQMMTDCIRGIDKQEIDATGLESGAAVLKGTGLIVEENIEENDILKIFVPDNATYNFEELPERDNRHYLARRRRRRELVEIGLETRNHRKLAATKGVLETLVVRVNAPNTPAGGEVADVSQLRDDIFIDSVSLRTQYAACSKNQLIIEPAPEHIATSGIVTVDISTSPSSGSSALQTDALNTATANFGNLPDQYDLVMFCQPGGSGGWVRYFYLVVIILTYYPFLIPCGFLFLNHYIILHLPLMSTFLIIKSILGCICLYK